MSTFTKTELLPGTQVKLKSNPSSAAGVVEGVVRGRIVVDWRSDGYRGRHAPDKLIVVAAPAASRENPYDRLIRRLREANECKSQTDNREGENLMTADIKQLRELLGDDFSDAELRKIAAMSREQLLAYKDQLLGRINENIRKLTLAEFEADEPHGRVQ